MRTGKIASIVVLGLILPFLTWGCQQEAGPLSSVSGRVAYKGVPLQGGTIVFVPDESKGQSGPIACGTIKPDGSYSLITKAPADGVNPSLPSEIPGAAAGWYRVTVSALAPASNQPSQPMGFPQSVIPEKYRNPELSRIVCEVKANQTNTINFDLE